MLGIPTDLIQASIRATNDLATAIEKLAAATDRQTEVAVAQTQRHDKSHPGGW